MRAATLFSGIGAPEVAMPHWDWLWHAEIEKFPAAVMASRHPQSVNLGDVTAPDFCDRAAAIGIPDVLVFGSPCQSYSVAGKRLGLDDPRGNLALVALGIIDRLRPAWFVFENVPGLFSSYSGSDETARQVLEGPDGGGAECDEDSDFAAFLAAVSDIGYCGVWTVLDAQFAGVAQRRERVFFVGCAGAEWQRAAAVLLEPKSLCGHPPARGQEREDVARSVVPSLTGSGRGVERAGESRGQDPLVVNTGRCIHGTHWSEPECRECGIWRIYPSSGERERALTSSNQRIDYETETLIAHSLRADGFDASEDGTGRGTPLVPTYAIQERAVSENQDAGQRGLGVQEGIAYTLESRQRTQAIAFTAKDYGADAQDNLSPTLRPGGHNKSHANAGVMPAIAFDARQSDVCFYGDRTGPLDTDGQTIGIAFHENQRGGVRRLTPRECERLQAFPDNYTLITYRGKLAADGPRYRAIGNSMCVNVVRWILERIERVDLLSPRSGEDRGR